MILDPNRYKASFPPIKRLYERDLAKADKDQETIITELTITSGVPILAICLYIQKEFGTNPELEDLMKRLNLFYGYREVKELE